MAPFVFLVPRSQMESYRLAFLEVPNPAMSPRRPTVITPLLTPSGICT